MLEKIVLHVLTPFKSAWKQVKSHFFQFSPFIFALLLIQSFLFTILFFYNNNFENEKNLIKSQYDYHVMVSGLNETQMDKAMELYRAEWQKNPASAMATKFYKNVIEQVKAL